MIVIIISSENWGLIGGVNFINHFPAVIRKSGLVLFSYSHGTFNRLNRLADVPGTLLWCWDQLCRSVTFLRSDRHGLRSTRFPRDTFPLPAAVPSYAWHVDSGTKSWLVSPIARGNGRFRCDAVATGTCSRRIPAPTRAIVSMWMRCECVSRTDYWDRHHPPSTSRVDVSSSTTGASHEPATLPQSALNFSVNLDFWKIEFCFINLSKRTSFDNVKFLRWYFEKKSTKVCSPFSCGH